MQGSSVCKRAMMFVYPSSEFGEFSEDSIGGVFPVLEASVVNTGLKAFRSARIVELRPWIVVNMVIQRINVISHQEYSSSVLHHLDVIHPQP